MTHLIDLSVLQHMQMVYLNVVKCNMGHQLD
jgi:hypothetical protein